MQDNLKELLQDIMRLQIKGTKEELERQIEEGMLDHKFLAQVTALLKQHDVKADLRDKEDLDAIAERMQAQRAKLLGRVRGEDVIN